MEKSTTLQTAAVELPMTEDHRQEKSTISSEVQANLIAHESDVNESTQQAEQIKPLSSREFLNESVEQLVSDINAKRKRDPELLEEFKKELDLQTARSVEKMEAALYNVYDKTSKGIDDKLLEFASVLNRIEKLEEELEEFKKALSTLYTDVQVLFSVEL